MHLAPPARFQKNFYLPTKTWHTVLVSSSISPWSPPIHASGPRARLSSVESDLQGEPWHGGTTGQRQPHRAREKVQNRRIETEAYLGYP